MPHGIFKGNSNDEIGQILAKTTVIGSDGTSHLSPNPLEIRAVFKRDRMIWPSAHKYKFWATTDKAKIEQDAGNITISVKAGDYPKGAVTEINVYLRSCSWHAYSAGKRKYAVRVESLSPWCTIGDDSATSVVVKPTSGDVVKSEPDAMFSLHVQPNYGTGKRTTRIRMYQQKTEDEDSIALIGGNVIYIDVVQEGDTIASIADYSGSKIVMYTDQSYSTVYTKDNAEEFAATGKSGTSQIYFRISGSVHMQSGAENNIFFGQRGERISASNFSFAQTSQISSIYDISNDNGNWSAKIKWNDNIADDDAMTKVIRNFSVSPGFVLYYGGQCTASFYAYKTGTSSLRSTLFTITIPNSDRWIGSKTFSGDNLVLWQEGATLDVPVTDADATIRVNDDAKEYVTESNDLSNPSIGYYSKTFTVQKQIPVVYTHIEDPKIYLLSDYTYQDSVPYTGGNIQLRFKIFTNSSTYHKRSFVITGSYGTLSESATVTQEAASEGTDIEVTASNYPNIASSMLVSNVTDNPEYEEFLSAFSVPRYLSSRWQVSAIAESNLKKEIAKMLTVTPIYDTLTSDAHSSANNKFPIEAMIKGGEVNSEQRYDGVKIVCDDIMLDDQINVHQSGSSDAQDTTYFDDIGVVILNKTDSMSCEVSRADSSHVYRGWLECKENNDKVPGVALVSPSTVSSWSLGTVRNDLTTTVFIQVKGYPVTKGQERTIEVSVSAKDLSCDSKTVNVTQEGKDKIIDYDKESYAEGLSRKDFTMLEGSEASMTGPAVYNGNGWYAIPLKIKDNTTPTHTSFSLYIGNEDMREKKYMYTIQEYNHDNILIPISGSWSQIGSNVTRTATLNVAGIQDIDLEWTDVPYNGNKKINSEPGVDYDIKITNGSDWLSLDLSSKYLVASKNMTTSKRNAIVSIRYKNGSEYLSDWISSSITQACMLSEDELGYSIEASPSELVIDEVNGSMTSPFTLVKSTDYEGTMQRIEVSVDNDGLDYAWTKSSNEYKVSFSSVEKLRTAPKQWIATISQKDNSQEGVLTGKSVAVNVKQPCYIFTSSVANGKSIVLEYGKELSITISSMKRWPDGTTEEVPFTVAQSDYDWVSIKEDNGNSSHSYILSAYSMNKGENNRSTRVVFKQSSTNETIAMTLIEPNWRESGFDESSIDIYYDKYAINGHISGQYIYAKWNIIRPFWSIVNEEESDINEINVSWDSGRTPSWVSCQIMKSRGNGYPEVITDKGNFVAFFSCGSILEGTVPVTDVIRIDNGVYGIGSCRVTKHAFIFNVGFEKDAEGTNVIYVSATATKVWSMYYVDSRMDNQDCPYTCTSSDRKCTINIKGNSIEVFANTSNTTNTRQTFKATIQQEYSKQIKQIAIIQLTKEDEADYDFYY